MSRINELKNRLLGRLRGPASAPEHHVERQLLVQCLLIAKMNRSVTHLRTLSDAEFCGFSQWGEDGIIDWLVERLPGIPRIFVEFGVEDYRESNTRLLLKLRNWHGLVMDGSQKHIADIMRQDIYWRYDLIAKCAFIERENVNNLIASSGIRGEIGLLSVDIDGNDYWVWQALDVVKPVIVVCEYNASFGDVCRVSVPYQPDFRRTGAHHSNLYFGASLPALIELATQKGYVFVGTNSNGCNAFFVRNDRAADVRKSIGEVRSFPSTFRESRDNLGQLTFARGESRVDVIRHLPVFDFDANAVKPLADLGELYSETWRQAY
ncbi:MAG: hypothetical protein JW384_03245 [Nitrosomonadaceae bacterium]|nr:hypothetical protein [Nitrosomonadaceae bacterium]